MDVNKVYAYYVYHCKQYEMHIQKEIQMQVFNGNELMIELAKSHWERMDRYQTAAPEDLQQSIQWCEENLVFGILHECPPISFRMVVNAAKWRDKKLAYRYTESLRNSASNLQMA